jgi:hypothetical protein
MNKISESKFSAVTARELSSAMLQVLDQNPDLRLHYILQRSRAVISEATKKEVELTVFELKFNRDDNPRLSLCVENLKSNPYYCCDEDNLGFLRELLSQKLELVVDATRLSMETILQGEENRELFYLKMEPFFLNLCEQAEGSRGILKSTEAMIKKAKELRQIEELRQKVIESLNNSQRALIKKSIRAALEDAICFKRSTGECKIKTTNPCAHSGDTACTPTEAECPAMTDGQYPQFKDCYDIVSDIFAK